MRLGRYRLLVVELRTKIHQLLLPLGTLQSFFGVFVRELINLSSEPSDQILSISQLGLAL